MTYSGLSGDYVLTELVFWLVERSWLKALRPARLREREREGG